MDWQHRHGACPNRYSCVMSTERQDSIHADFGPAQRVLVVRQNPETNQRESVWLRWGLVPYSAEEMLVVPAL